MIVIFYGTSAELIKMYGIIKSIPRDQQLLVCNAQQYTGLQKLHDQLDIHPDYYLAKGWRGKDVSNMLQMLGMMLTAHVNFLLQYFSIKKQIKTIDAKLSTKSIVLIHGDTLTTVVGGYLGRVLGLKVGHVEAGLRSGSWKSPFPEELDRRIAAKIATVHFAPNEEAKNNLVSEKVHGDVLSTTYNTAKDAIEQSSNFVSSNFAKLNLPNHYCLVLLHRTELLENKNLLRDILEVLHHHADKGNNIVFTMHTTTKARIESYDYMHLLQHKNITVIPKQPYFDFMAIVRGADYAVTDGGGLQEDCYFLGIPLIVHRERTERSDGIGINATISKMKTSAVSDFLENHPDKSAFQAMNSSISPSQVVTSYLSEQHYIK